jgi:two-component system, OmpR family, sensor kinase
MGIVRRLMIVHVVLMALLMSAVLVVATQAVDAIQMGSLQSDLQEEPQEFDTAALNRPPGQSLDNFAAAYVSLHVGSRLLVAIDGGGLHTSPNGAVLRDIPEVAAWLRNPPSGSALATVHVAQSDYLVLVSPVVVDGRRVGVMIAAGDLGHLRDESRGLIAITAAEAGAALLIALAASYLLLRRLLRRVDNVTAAAATIDREQLGKRINLEGPEDEVGRLGRTFDSMLARLEMSFRAQRDLLSDVSHQLRTPLTVVRGHLEVLRRTGMTSQEDVSQTMEVVLNELNQMSSEIDRLLLLGRAAEPDFVDAEEVDLRSLMADVFDASKALASRKWTLGPVPDVVLNVDRVKLRGALLNLADNAANATGEGDAITLAASANGAVELTVTDTGRGVPAEDQAHIFDRFARGTNRLGGRGAGLGLAIVKAVAEAHGGKAILKSPPGRGCTVSIVLPSERVVGRLNGGRPPE